MNHVEFRLDPRQCPAAQSKLFNLRLFRGNECNDINLALCPCTRTGGWCCKPRNNAKEMWQEAEQRDVNKPVLPSCHLIGMTPKLKKPFTTMVGGWYVTNHCHASITCGCWYEAYVLTSLNSAKCSCANKPGRGSQASVLWGLSRTAALPISN